MQSNNVNVTNHTSVDGNLQFHNVDQSGNVDGFDDYYPFGLGMPNRSDNSANDTDKYKFTGHERDTEASRTLDYMMARNYDPALGRFLQIDPLADEFPGWTPYHYVHNNPLKFTDPTGMAACPPACGDQLYKFFGGYYEIAKSFIPSKQTSGASLEVGVGKPGVASTGYKVTVENTSEVTESMGESNGVKSETTVDVSQTLNVGPVTMEESLVTGDVSTSVETNSFTVESSNGELTNKSLDIAKGPGKITIGLDANNDLTVGGKFTKTVQTGGFYAKVDAFVNTTFVSPIKKLKENITKYAENF